MRRIARLTTLIAAAAVCLWGEPRRIVSTAPGITEILFALGFGDRIVGATEYCVYPEAAKKIRRTGTWMSPNLEAVLEVRPDLVIVQKTAIHSSTVFTSLKLRTIEIQLETVPDILQTIETIGAAAGVPEEAAKLLASIRTALDQVRKRVAGRAPVSAMFIVGRTPGALEGMIVVGKRSYQSEVMEIAGGRNIFADSAVAYPKVVHEEILARNPEVIIDMGEHADASPLSEQQKRAEIALWNKYPSLKAVRNGRIYPVSSAIFVVPGPRVVELAKEYARMLHPESAR